jgi:hypothetical protein
MFEKLKKNSKKYSEETSLAIKRLETIISKKLDLIYIFRLDSEEGEQDFELTILRAFLNCEFKIIFKEKFF